MQNKLPFTPAEEPSSLTSQLLFIRRTDLSSQERLKIASVALFFAPRGTISRLSKQYLVSRQFIYNLRNRLVGQLPKLFGMVDKSASKIELRQQLIRTILSLRLIGCCSLWAISDLLTQLNLGKASVSFISQTLTQIGLALPSTLEGAGQVVYLCDEVYAPEPILVTVEPHSMAILRIEKAQKLTAEQWQHHWTQIQVNGYQALGLVKDEGSEMNKAQQVVLPQVPVQSDTFHAVAYRLGAVAVRLEQQALKAIEKEYEREQIWKASQQRNWAAVQQKQKASYEQARTKALQKLQTYDDFLLGYHFLLEQLQVFDTNGQLRSADQAKKNAQEAILFLRQLPIANLHKSLNSIQNRVEQNLFAFLDRALSVVANLEKKVGSLLLPFWTKAWQTHKNLLKAKSAKQRKFINKQNRWIWRFLMQEYQLSKIDFEAFKQSIFAQLNTIVQSSALVEAVNSIIRKYTKMTKNQVSQPLLNLIMFFHNHRKFNRGERKGFAPIELLQKIQLKLDPIDLILEYVK